MSVLLCTVPLKNCQGLIFIYFFYACGWVLSECDACIWNLVAFLAYGSGTPKLVRESEIGDFDMWYGEKKPREGEFCIFVQQNKGVIVAQEVVL